MPKAHLQLSFSRATVAGIFMAVVAGAAALIAYVYLPRAVITLSPRVSPRTAEQPIVLSTGANAPDFKHFILPATVVRKELREEQTIQRAGVETREDFARGTLKLINKQTDEQNLLPKTHLRHEASGVFFLTDSAVRIPPEAEITVSVTAKEQGARGNVPAGRFVVDKLPAALQSRVYAESEAAFSGGQITDTPISEAEIEKAFEDALEAVQRRLHGDLALASGGAAIRPELLHIEVLAKNATVEAGSQASTFTVVVQVSAAAFLVDENDLLGLTLLGLRGKQHPDEEMSSYDPGSFAVHLSAVSFERGEARITGSLTGNFSRKLGSSVLEKSHLPGLSAEEVREHFRQFDTVGEVDVKLSPFWVTRVPARLSAISLTIE